MVTSFFPAVMTAYLQEMTLLFLKFTYTIIIFGEDCTRGERVSVS